MKVADSSFLVEGLLKRKEFLEEDLLLTVDLAVHEVANSIWKHECILKDIDDGFAYVSILERLIGSRRIQIIRADSDLMKTAYSLSARNKCSLYDTVYVSLALESGLELVTFDKRQSELLRRLTRDQKDATG